MPLPSTRTCQRGTCQPSGTWTRCSICSVMPLPSTRTCQNGTCQPSPICTGCSITRSPSTRTCQLGTCQPSMTCHRCSRMQHLLIRYYVAFPGSSLKQIKSTCLQDLQDRYHRQCAQQPQQS